MTEQTLVVYIHTYIFLCGRHILTCLKYYQFNQPTKQQTQKKINMVQVILNVITLNTRRRRSQLRGVRISVLKIETLQCSSIFLAILKYYALILGMILTASKEYQPYILRSTNASALFLDMVVFVERNYRKLLSDIVNIVILFDSLNFDCLCISFSSNNLNMKNCAISLVLGGCQKAIIIQFFFLWIEIEYDP